MQNWFARATLAALICVFTATAAGAQEMIAEKHSLTGYAARKIIEVCLAQAARDHFPVALAVVDPAGYLLSYQAADGATGNTGETAQLKAKTAARFRRSTAELYDRINKQVNRAPEWQRYFAIPGGYPIVVGGEVVGAIGVGAAGLSGGKDEDCAQSAVKTVMGDGKAAPPPSPQPLLATDKVLTAAAARKLADACIAYAGANKIRGISVSVVDADGNLLSFQSTNGTSSNGLKSAQLKAVTAAHWRRATADLFQRVNTKINRAPEWKGDFPEPGGFPIFIGNDIVGAIGAGGGVGAQDGQCAEAAVKAVFPNAATARAS
ncbi:MAG TPA: heme-binding protein [Micropepsaceae bacterium]|nr:heme-binding protein [Micropepsaceae bacterium]